MLTQMVEVSSVLKHVSRTLMSHCYLLMRSSSLAKGSLDKDSVISHSLSASGWTEPFSPLLARGFQLFKTKSFSIIWENVACLCPGRWYGIWEELCKENHSHALVPVVTANILRVRLHPSLAG